MLELSPMTTSPISVAVGARKTLRPMRGTFPLYSMIMLEPERGLPPFIQRGLIDLHNHQQSETVPGVDSFRLDGLQLVSLRVECARPVQRQPVKQDRRNLAIPEGCRIAVRSG